MAFLVALLCCFGIAASASIGVNDNGRTKRGLLKEGLDARQVSTNCRTVIAYGVNDPVMCSKIEMGMILKFDPLASPTFGKQVYQDIITGDKDEIDHDKHHEYTDDYGNLDISKLPGRCRYDPYRALLDPNSACLCVATQETCEYGRDGCHWYENYKNGYKECISKAERFYNQLAELLRKRGKKSFAIKIRYGATAARGELPYGPYGPAVIGMGNPNQSKTYGVYKNHHHQPGYGQSRPAYGYSPSPPQTPGYGPQPGYGHNPGYGSQPSYGGSSYGGGGSTYGGSSYGGGGNSYGSGGSSYGGGGSNYGGGGNSYGPNPSYY